MSYQVLARKWRPKSFDALVGQDHVVRALTNALDQQRLHHAYLFTGTRGVGKTTLARILAKSLNCETGVTAHPCGQCAACLDIDKGRFVDMLEVDAASNTQVDSMRELLENAQYAPTAGRFKVYIIDEVHMLSRNAFNAMLKTLEEPPAHVKFILATTDPQKLPVTVLSRCLQFNLRQMSVAAIAEHLQTVLTQEGIACEPVALQLLARAASGSMRDALSLLDQAIAYGGEAVRENEVRAMLGAVDQGYLYALIDALVERDGAAVLAQAQAMDQRSLSFDTALVDLANLLHQVAVVQTVPESLAADLPEREKLLELSGKISPEDIQLYYQIALLGRRDLGLAPDEYAGFTMTLLRMLAFTPSGHDAVPGKKTIAHTAPAPVAIPRPAATAKLASEPEPAASAIPLQNAEMSAPSTADPAQDRNFDGDWRSLVDNLKLGLARALAQNCELVRHEDNAIYLSVPEAQKHLLEASYQEKLRTAIAHYFGRKMQLNFAIGGSGNTPAQQRIEEKAALQSQAESAIRQDDFVQALVKDFGAQIIPSSIKPI